MQYADEDEKDDIDVAYTAGMSVKLLIECYDAELLENKCN